MHVCPLANDWTSGVTVPSDVVFMSWSPLGPSHREWSGHCKLFFVPTRGHNAVISLSKEGKHFAYTMHI